MRRKVIQDFANTFCQRVLNSPNWYDLATFAYLGSGTYALDILAGECTHNGTPIRRLHTCDVYSQWLQERCQQHHIDFTGILSATMTLAIAVTDFRVLWRTRHYTVRSATYAFDCHSRIATDERGYLGHASGEHTWGLGEDWEQLYGDEPPPWLPTGGQTAG